MEQTIKNKTVYIDGKRSSLYRGKKCSNGEWIYGRLLVTPDSRFFIADIENNEEIIPRTLGDYTGLTDKNDTQVFHGDIVKGSDGERIVIYRFREYRARTTDSKEPDLEFFRDSKKFEVIGNIYDTPYPLELSGKI